MAIDNLNYYSAWLPAGQQTDRYSSQPWCLRSKNLDIFSSSKSVKATAFSQPTAWEWWVIAEEWWLVLKSDWKVYERTDNWDVLFVDPAANFPAYQVDYEWDGTYETATRWTPLAMTVASEWDTWKSFIVYTDRASFTYSKVKYTLNKTFWNLNRFTSLWYASADGYLFEQSSAWSSWYIEINMERGTFCNVPIKIKATQNESSDTNISLDKVEVYYDKYQYDSATDSILPSGNQYERNLTVTWDIFEWISIDVPVAPYSYARAVRIYVDFTKKASDLTYAWSGTFYVDINWWTSATHRMPNSTWDYNSYYSYLPIKNRELVEVWVYGYSMAYWMKWTTFQALYKWVSSWVTESWISVLRYDFVADMWWENAPWMDVIWLIVWNEQVYMIGNLNWDWYIIPCDLTWWTGTAYVAYGCTFTWVANIDYLLYLVWENRGISTLWVFNQQELVPIIWGNKESWVVDLVNTDEQYNFDWHIVNWRKNLILTTSDNRIFQYWQTFGGKGWVFIHELPSEATITWLKANWNDLEINYSITESWTTTNYSITYQDDTPIKNYNIEWMAEYPIVLWNHLLEKEESDLYVSYILPSSNTSLEFWGMANHYHFRTFRTTDRFIDPWYYDYSPTENYKMKWCSWNYNLKFVERNGTEYTFRLEWDLPKQSSDDMEIIDKNGNTCMTYVEYNHFRKIWGITTTEYQEWEFRFHNLNNKLELPKSHSLQIMVKGKGNQNYTPELFALDLVANQRERW